MITHNRDNYGGPGAFLATQEDSRLDAVFNNVRIEKNRTTGEAAGVEVYAIAYRRVVSPAPITLRMVNPVISKNVAKSSCDAGGGLVVANNTFGAGSDLVVDVVSSTITGNVLRGHPGGHPITGGGGIAVKADEAPVVMNLVNSIVWGITYPRVFLAETFSKSGTTTTPT